MKKTNIRILDNYAKWAILSGYSESTIDEYLIHLKIFFKFLVHYYKWEIGIEKINVFFLVKVDEESLIAFLSYLKYERNNAMETIDFYCAIIKTFYKWLFQKYTSTFNNKKDPTYILQDYLVTTKKLPKYIELNKALALQNIFTLENSKNYLRNNTIITLFLNTGLRLSELISLNIDDINFDTKSFRVKGKGSKWRTVYLSSKAVNMLQSYLKTRIDNNEALFISSGNQRISKRSVQNICKQAYNLIGLEDGKYTTHTLRHTIATYIYKDTKDLLVVKEFLGHSSIASTEIYVHIANDEAKKAVESNPLSNFMVGGGSNID